MKTTTLKTICITLISALAVTWGYMITIAVSKI
jgi:hypothetical protein